MARDATACELMLEFIRRADEPGAEEDPGFFELKARAFEAMAAEGRVAPVSVASALRFAERARAEAERLRAAKERG